MRFLFLCLHKIRTTPNMHMINAMSKQMIPTAMATIMTAKYKSDLH